MLSRAAEKSLRPAWFSEDKLPNGLAGSAFRLAFMPAGWISHLAQDPQIRISSEEVWAKSQLDSGVSIRKLALSMPLEQLQCSKFHNRSDAAI